MHTVREKRCASLFRLSDAYNMSCMLADSAPESANMHAARPTLALARHERLFRFHPETFRSLSKVLKQLSP